MFFVLIIIGKRHLRNAKQVSDAIIGVSILQPIWVPGIYRLWFTAQKGSGEKNQGWVFIKDKASVGLPDRMPNYPDCHDFIWKFTRNGLTVLDCTPSVNWTSWGFHNSGSWSTVYYEMTLAEKAESKAGPEPTRYERGSAVHYDVNNTSDPTSAGRLVLELIQAGILK